MSNPDLRNPWDKGGQLASDWSGENAKALDTDAIGEVGGDHGTSLILEPPPPIFAQSTPTTCWAAATLSWLSAIIPETGSRFQFPEDLISYERTKKCSDGAPVLNPDDSLRYAELFLWHAVIADLIHECGSSQTISSSLLSSNDFTYDRLSIWIRGLKYILVGDIRSAVWKHAYVVYGVDRYLKDYPVMYTMDPDGGVLDEKRIPPSQGIFLCTAKS